MAVGRPPVAVADKRDAELELRVRRVEAQSFATRVKVESYRIHRLIVAGFLVEAERVSAGLHVEANRFGRQWEDAA